MTHDLTPPQGRDVTRYVHHDPPPGPGYPPTPLPDEEIRLGALWALISRNRWTIAIFIGCALFLAALYNALATPIWRASATIRLEEMERNPLASETAALIGFSSDEEIETEMEVLRSKTMAGRVADSLALQVQVARPEEHARAQIFASVHSVPDAVPGAYVLERDGDGFRLHSDTGEDLGPAPIGSPTTVGGVTFSLAPSAREHDPIEFTVLPRREAVRAMASQLSIRQVKPDVSMIEVVYEGPDSSLVAQIPNQYARLFMAQRRSEHRTEASSTVDFLREQIDSISVDLIEAEQELRAFQEAEGVVALQAEGEARIGQVAALQAQRDALEAESYSMGRLLQEAESAPAEPGQPSPYRGLVAYPRLLAASATSSLLSNLANLENERQGLLTQRTEDDMDVQALTARIESIEDQLHSMATTYHRGITREVSSLESSLGREAGILSTIPRKQLEMSRRQRETQLLQQVYTLLQTRLKEAEIAEAVQDPSARIVDPASIDGGPVKPRSLMNFGLALVLGAMAGLGAAVLREARDKTVHTREDLKRLTGAPVLALIPYLDSSDRSLTRGRMKFLTDRLGGNGQGEEGDRRDMVLAAGESRGAVSEAFRTLRTNVTFTAADEVPRTLMITSALPSDGKTITSINLAHAFAQQGLSVIIVDADLRRGQIHSVLETDCEPGLSNVLIDAATIDAAVRRLTLQEVELDVLPRGTSPPNPSELLGGSRMRWLLEQLVERYDHVIFDTPPVSLVADASVLAPLMEGVLLVARAGYTEEAAIKNAMEQLLHVGAPVKGTILNCIDERSQRYSGYSYDNRYHAYYTAE